MTAMVFTLYNNEIETNTFMRNVIGVKASYIEFQFDYLVFTMCH